MIEFVYNYFDRYAKIFKKKGGRRWMLKRKFDSSQKNRVEVDLPELQSDPGKRLKNIIDFDPNIHERVRRKYYLDGAFQPREHEFPQALIQGTLRRFNRAWFDEFKWLEYSIEKDAALCLYCYLFKNELGHQGGGDTFVSEGFRDWKNKDKLRKHEGGHNSAHKKTLSKCQDLLNQEQHIETSLARSSEQNRQNYRVPFRGHDESQNSINQGNFLELLKFLACHNEEVRRVSFDNAPGNDKLICHNIQKDIVRSCAWETTNVILKELGDNFFSILLDESRDVSVKEQLAIVLRFVDSKGCVVERLLGFKHFTRTTAQALKCALLDLLSAHGLSVSRIRGQRYDGASNMQGEINGLKDLILKENECAYYIHCFAHQLQLALIAVAKNHINIASLFHVLCNIVNVVGGSCKRHDSLREKQAVRIIQALENEEITKGRGLNQESTLNR
ncbi:uncharacterized protein [Henckelia pumila]|uniref:uncharacterized protein n=1 Tax=Henckelia pumila TaxID=405737 RepID=UPI003C6E647B